MFGNLLSNRIILELIRDGELRITPFDPALLRAAHYPLLPKQIFHVSPDKGPVKRVHSFDEDDDVYDLDPGEYCVIEVREIIILPHGIIGQFVPASNLIESGLGITAGRLEYPFGKKGETIRFGVKNLLENPSPLRASDYLAYIQLFDLRGQGVKPTTMSKRDAAVFVGRIETVFSDSGVLADPYVVYQKLPNKESDRD